MVARKVQNSKFGRCRGRFLNFGLSFKMVDRRIQNLSFDRCRGRNYNFGIKEQIIFPEIKFDNVDTIRGMDVCINTSATNKEDAKALLEVFRIPI